ncbi:hypothetical protein ACF0H5_001902 [Mactra antiquata]
MEPGRRGTGFIYLQMCIVYCTCIPKVCSQVGSSATLVETELPIIDNVDIVKETNASSPLLCSQECLRNGCVGFLFQTDEPDDLNHCYSTRTHFGYNGTLDKTINGHICQNWADQSPISHSQVATHMPESSLSDAKNYCRDPDGSGFLWCYTIEPDVTWGKCNVYPCVHKKYIVDDNRCYSNGDPSSYNGTLAVTTNGYTCQNWADQTTHSHQYDATYMPENNLTEAKNYCRSPDNVGFNWCFTTNTSVRWEPCDVTPCITEDRNSEDIQCPTKESIHLQCPTKESIHLQCPPKESIHLQYPTKESIHLQCPTKESIHLQYPTKESIHLQCPTKESIHLQCPTKKVYTYSAHQKKIFTYSVEQKKVYTYSVQQKKVYTYSAQQKKVYTYSVQQKKVYTYSAQQKKVYTYSAQQKKLYTYSVQQRKYTPTVSNKRKYTPTVPNKRKYTPTVSNKESIHLQCPPKESIHLQCPTKKVYTYSAHQKKIFIYSAHQKKVFTYSTQQK